MSQFLGKSTAEQSTKAILAHSAKPTKVVVSVARPSRVVIGKEFQRGAGPVAAVVAFGFDAKELIDNEYAYRRGGISVRQQNTQLVSTLGGMAGITF